jgi:NAD(P)-dependent dehydrogenase (short-subunit alcohol dehydrogenase family)
MSRARRVAVVTGATGGMGRVIARELARRDMHVVTIARDPIRADALRERIARTAPGGAFEVIAGDLSTRAGIAAAAGAVADRHGAVHVLVNNAGAHFAEHRRSPDGLEMHIAVDYLAAFGLTALLQPQLRAGRARVVNVASDTLRDTRRLKLIGRPRPARLEPSDLDDLTRLNPARGFVPFEAYARAKLMTVLSGYDFARTMAGDVTVNAVHPGIVATDIIDDLVPPVLRPLSGLIRRGMLSPEDGATAALRLAVDPALASVTGRYFVRDVDTPTPPSSYDQALQDRLHITSHRFFGLAGTHGGAGDAEARPFGSGTSGTVRGEAPGPGTRAASTGAMHSASRSADSTAAQNREAPGTAE